MRILLYHRVTPASDIGPMTRATAVDPVKFEQQIVWIKSKVVALEEALDPTFDRSLDRIAVSFDDGYLDNHKHAFPILKRHNIPATIFLATGHIDNRKNFWWDRVDHLISNCRKLSVTFDGAEYRLATDDDRHKVFDAITQAVAREEPHLEVVMRSLERAFGADSTADPCLLMTWDHIKEMRQSGIRFGSHSCNHRRLALVRNPDTLKVELSKSKERLQDELGDTGIGFAYPYGRETDYPSSAEALLKEAGYSFGCTAVMKTFDAQDSVYEIPRINISRADSAVSFHMKASTWYPQLYHRARLVTGRHRIKTWEALASRGV